MFSPANAIPPSASTRSSRRRQRPASSEGSISQPKAKRQRSALSEQTFAAPDGSPEMQEVKPFRATNTISRRDISRNTTAPRHELVVRGKKTKLAERGTKSDGSVVLTKNETYSVSRLPAWPDRLQGDSKARQHGAIYSDSGYAITLTHTHALVWPYSTNTTSPETFTFALPHPSKHASDPLPLGSLVSSSASSPEPGLVVVIPNTGRITYWESVTSATTMDLIKQQRHGVESMIQGMLSGETVLRILNAEPAGFVLGFSTGRLAFMGVRDGQGRPSISVQFLRGTAAMTGGGIFGSLRNALSSSAWRGDLAAARAGPFTKPGERNVVTASTKGKLQAWNLHRGGHYSLQAECEGRELIVQALKESDPSLADLLLETFEILDFAFPPLESNGDGLPVGNSDPHLLLLTSLSGRGASHYALVQVVLRPESLEIGLIRHIRSYATPVQRTATSRPRLLFPGPALVSFIVFDRAVIVASMAAQPNSPDYQLLADRNLVTESFEDVVDFRADSGAEIVGSGMEEPYQAAHSSEDAKSRRYKAKVPAAVLLVKGGGVIRVAVIDVDKFVGDGAPQVTAKSKLEQAVFFGNQENNPLDFTGRAEIQFTTEEMGSAALAVSHEILSSRTAYIPSLPASIDENLRRRAAALRSLAAHLKETNVALDRLTRWKLLWDAEKMAGATVVWNRYDESVREKSSGPRQGLLAEIVEFIHENYKTEPVAEFGELDRARHWFINDVWRLEIAVPWAYQAVKVNYQEGQKDHAEVMILVSEADDFVTGALQGAFGFREANLGLYGLQSEDLENGILRAGYENLPEFWTSTALVSESVGKLTDLAYSLANEYWQKSGEGLPDLDVTNKVRKENVQLVDLCTRSTIERCRWLSSQDDRMHRSQGENLSTTHIVWQEIQISRLADIGLVYRAIELAEKHRVFSTLVSLVVEELERINEVLGEMVKTPEIDEDTIKATSERALALSDRVGGYFKLFGANFANAMYKYYVGRGELFALLDDNDEHQQYLTNFLRSKPELAKVAWIHEVTQEEDFDRAAKSLLDLGLRREREVWSKKVELSIGKLARLTGKSYSEADGLLVPDGGHADLAEATKQLALIQIQEKISTHILPAISAAIDENAEVQLALEVYGNSALDGRQAMSVLVEENMGHLVAHEALDALSMIDLLTLMGENVRREAPDLMDGEEFEQFYLALQALKSGPTDKEDRGSTERLIWRRCMLRDDWTEMNNTDLKDDLQISEQLRQTALYSTLKACLKNRLFEKSNLSPISPRAALGAFTEDLDDRFRGLDASIREPLLTAMRAENDALQQFVDKCRLEKWFEGTVDLARRDVQDEANEETAEGEAMKKMKMRLQEREHKIASDARKAAMNMLRSKPRYKPRTKLNGSVGGFKSSLLR